MAEMPTEEEVIAFRERYRLELIERIALKALFAAPVVARALTLKQSHKALSEWLEENIRNADSTYGEHFGDPAMAALYADEVKDVVDGMKNKLDALLKEMTEKGFR